MLSKFKNILFWSVISAAFIGPGTVTVAAQAGASFGLSLLWALTFSIIATLILQEGAARLTICSGTTLGNAVSKRFGAKPQYSWMVFLAVAIGCGAYEAGNIMGGVSGILLIYDVNKEVLVTIIGLLAIAILWTGRIKLISNALGIVVAIMGIAFFSVALNTDLDFGKILISAVTPSFPESSSLLVIGLVGTTVVPYNLFLGSGISTGQNLQEMRVGLGWAILIGGAISCAVLMVGSGIEGEFSFVALVNRFENSIGNWSGILIGVGLFAAGFTSCVTAPLATAITGQSIFSKNRAWDTGNKNFRLTWLIILIIGLAFGITDFRPIPIIILAQALNGLLLPFVASILWITLNNAKVMNTNNVNSVWMNLITGVVVFISIFLGMNNLSRATMSMINYESPGVLLPTNLIASAVLTIFISYLVYRERN